MTFTRLRLVAGPEVEDGGEDASPGADPGPPVNSGAYTLLRAYSGGRRGRTVVHTPAPSEQDPVYARRSY